MISENPGRSEARAQLLFKAFQSINNFTGPHTIDIAKRSAKKRRETEPQYSAQISICGILQDLLLQTPRRFIDHNQSHSMLDGYGIGFRTFLSSKEPINVRIWIFLLTRALSIGIKAP